MQKFFLFLKELWTLVKSDSVARKRYKRIDRFQALDNILLNLYHSLRILLSIFMVLLAIGLVVALLICIFRFALPTKENFANDLISHLNRAH